MTSPDDGVALTLARMRRDGWLPLAALPVAEAEERVGRAGRQVFLGDGGNAERIAVLGWRDVDPAPSQQSPRLARRVLSRAATKVLVIVYALLTDPETDRSSGHDRSGPSGYQTANVPTGKHVGCSGAAGGPAHRGTHSRR